MLAVLFVQLTFCSVLTEAQYLRKRGQKQMSVWQAQDGQVTRMFCQTLLISLRKDVDQTGTRELTVNTHLLHTGEHKDVRSPAELSAVQSTAPTPPAAVLLREKKLPLFLSRWGSEPKRIHSQHAPSHSGHELHDNSDQWAVNNRYESRFNAGKSLIKHIY